MSNKLVSVIIPVYKVEKYINRCIESIINQTYKNLEIILVDDGSPDNCPSICDKWAKQDSRIIVVHKTNGGLSDARNVGIEKSIGEYISFVDSDDYINYNMISHLVNSLEKYAAEISCCNFQYVYEDSIIDQETVATGEEKIYKKAEVFAALFKKDVPTEIVCNKLYKKELFEGCRFKIGRLHEDSFIMHYLLDKAEKMVYINEPLYYYFMRENSIMNSAYTERKLDAVYALEDRLQYCINKKPQFIDLARSSLLDNLAIQFYLAKKSKVKKEILKIICSKFNDQYSKNKKHKLNQKIFKFDRKLYCILYKIFRANKRKKI